MENNYEIVGVLDYYGSHFFKKKINTIFVNDKTLKIKNNKSKGKIVVKQLGRNNGLLSQSNIMNLSEDYLAKK